MKAPSPLRPKEAQRLTRLIRQCHEANVKQARLRSQLDVLCMARYGDTPSNLNCEAAIECLDYQASPLDAAEFEKAMLERLDEKAHYKKIRS